MKKIKIYSESKHVLPNYAKDGDSGFDIPANLPVSIILAPLERKLIPTGIYAEIEKGYEIQVRPKSGNSLKKKYDVKLGTVDSNYRGEIGVIVQNLSSSHCEIKDGEFIAQIVIAAVEYPERITVNKLEDLGTTDRGGDGFGSTGSNAQERKEGEELKPKVSKPRASKAKKEKEEVNESN